MARIYAKAVGYKNGQVFGSLRAAVTGQKVSPPTFETMEILGKTESIRRIEAGAANHLLNEAPRLESSQAETSGDQTQTLFVSCQE